MLRQMAKKHLEFEHHSLVPKTALYHIFVWSLLFLVTGNTTDSAWELSNSRDQVQASHVQILCPLNLAPTIPF